MDKSYISIAFLALLVIFFIVLVVLTIVTITKSKRRKKSVYSEDEYYDGDEAYYSEDDYDGAEDDYVEADDDYADAEDDFTDVKDDYADAEHEHAEYSDIDSSDEAPLNSDSAFAYSAFTDSAFAETEEEQETEQEIKPEIKPETESPRLLSNEELTASVEEAMKMGAAVTGESVVAAFGIEEALDGPGRKKRKKSTVSSSADFYWYNKMDVAEKPIYKTADMYYHRFNIAKDVIEDLLVEMYDCALVRTEEIKYIAYGIEPRAVSMKEILSAGNKGYTATQKLKQPSEADLEKIYQKWCGYVDKLFDKVEIYADEFTITEIRTLLCEYGRSDVDILIEGK